MTIVLAIVGLGLLILVHEAGHFAVSLALRMRPRRFYIGFPPAVLKTTRGGIEYGIGAIPLGGFVKIPGMHRPAPSDVDSYFGAVVADAPDLAGPVDRVRRSIAAGDMDAARAGLPALTDAIHARELSPLTLESAERGVAELDDALGPDAYWRAKTWKRVAVIFAGPAANIVLAIVLFTAVFATSGREVTSTVDSVLPKSPAAAVGLRVDDTLLAIGGAQVEPDGISRAIGASAGTPITVTVLRDGQLVELGPVAARKTEGAYRLGFVLRGEELSAPAATRAAFSETGRVTKEIGASLGRLVRGDGRDEIASPIGIVQGSSEAAKNGADSYVWVLALISLSIALLNLLPLLPLDGGHILFAIVEGVRGRSVGREIYERVSVVGIGIVLLLFFIGLTNDIGRLS